MPLKLKKYPKRSPNWYIRGTVAGIFICESARTTEKTQAEAFRIRREREIWERGALGREAPASFADAVNAYLDHGKPTRFIGPLLDHFKDKPLNEIGQAEIDRCAHVLYPGRKASTLVRQVYGPAIAILNHAGDVGLPGLVRRRIRMPRVAKVSARWASDDHVSALLPHCSNRLRALILVMTYTGLRASEVLRLRPHDFKLRTGWVNVASTKNGEPAFVPLPPETLDAVTSIMPDRLQPVFGFTTVQGVNKALQRAAYRAGLPYLSTHQIGRHTFAARLLNAGFDIKTVKEAGRWKKLAIVDDTYGHLEQRAAHDAMLSVGSRAKSV